MSRRVLWLLPLLMVPVIVGGIIGGIVYLLPSATRLLAPATPELARPAATVPAAASAEAVPVADANQTSQASTAAVPTLQPAQTAEFDAEDKLLTQLFRERSPAVVAFRVRGTAAEAQEPAFALPSPLPSSFALPDGNAQPFEPQVESQGSGFVIDDQGHIVTNNHVVEGAELIEVTFPSGLTVEAEVVGTDPDSDLAVVKVAQMPEGLQPLPLGNSGVVEVGQRAIAIGNPFGLQTTLTVGVVSARGRTFQSDRISEGGARFSIADLIQTDASINPGNSGGPLFNSRGEVIGVNTAIRSQSGTNEGVGFAVPSNTVAKVSRALIETGDYEHPYLGIAFSYYPLTSAVAEELKLPVQQGVFISAVVPGGPAEKAGLIGVGRQNEQEVNGDLYPVGSDIILKIDDRSVVTSENIIDYLATDTVVGQTVTLTILRDGQEQQVEVTLGARPE